MRRRDRKRDRHRRHGAAGSPAPPTSTRSGPTCATASSRSSCSPTTSCAAAASIRRCCSNPRYVKAASALDDIDLFDAPFFGYSPREAELIDPQQRLFLECAWEALERAGYDPEALSRAIGVFAGAGFEPLPGSTSSSNPELVQSVGVLQAGIGSTSDYLPTRVSYKLNLRGPSLNVQTACSTSLVAVHQACRSLRRRRVRHGAGRRRVDRRLPSKPATCTSKTASCRRTATAARSTRTRAARSAATASAWCVLKRLADALADGDTIHAVIRGTAINNDGSGKVGYTAPSVDGQAAVIARAQAVAGVEPATIGYVEAHGTGTALGDPIEIAALTQAFGPGGRGHVRDRLAQDQRRPPRCRGGRRRADQDGAGARAPRAAAEPALRDAEPADRFRRDARSTSTPR